MWTPLSAMRGGRPVAVLRVDDQRAGRTPNVCVRTGRPTVFAARVGAPALPGAPWWELVVGHGLTVLVAMLLRRPRLEVVLGADEPVWRQWRARLTFAVVVAAVGAGIAAAGIVGGAGSVIVFGLLIAAAGWLLRVRALLQCWVSLDHSADGLIRVVRAHPAFDAAARELFARSVERGR